MNNPFSFNNWDASHTMCFHSNIPQDELIGEVRSVVAAYADEFLYNYDYLVHFLTQRNKYYGWYVSKDMYKPLPVPTKIEFLETLEFRESEIRRALNDVLSNGHKKGQYHTWHWPSFWGKVHWNSGIDSTYQKTEDIYSASLRRHLSDTEKAIETHKILMGHLSPYEFDREDNAYLSDFLNLFVESQEFKMSPLPHILLSYDLPEHLVVPNNCENVEQWDIDRMLGEYCPSVYCNINVPYTVDKNDKRTIILYKRGIEKCSEKLGFAESWLRQVVILHELAHWASSEMIINGQTWDKNNYDKTDSYVHEGIAQLLTFWVLNSDALIVFEKLNNFQSTAYLKFKDILNICDCKKDIMNSLVELRMVSGGATFTDWLNILKR